MSEPRSYDVGYGKPPKGTRFQKGQSGNPRGRPKGSLNVATALERELNQRVTIKENGQTRSITKFEAAIKQLANKAASGDAKAIQFLVNLVNVSNGGALSDAPLTVPNEADRAVMATLMRRFQPQTPQPHPEEHPNDSKS
jgi:pyruvate/2-oxoglutarate dehydrogenase complex dihydrolipoamide acyltransferase (E2) component